MDGIILYLIPILFIGYGILYFDFSNKKNGKSFLLILIYVYLTLFMGLRYKVGGDTLTYMDWYQWAPTLDTWKPIDVLSPFEGGFTLLCALAKQIGSDFFILQLIHASIINLLIFLFIKRNTRYIFSGLAISVLIFYLYFLTETMREAFAVYIFLLNLKAYYKKEWCKYYCGIVLAMFFHIGAVFLIILPIFYHLKLDNKYYILLFTSILLFLVIQNLMSHLENIPIIGHKIGTYGQIEHVGYIWQGMRCLQYSIIPYIAIKLYHYYTKQQYKYENLLLVLTLIGLGILFSPVIFQRFTNYFLPLLSVFYTNVLFSLFKSSRGRKARVHAANFISSIILISYGLGYVAYSRYELWYPYASVLNPIEYSFREKYKNGGHD